MRFKRYLVVIAVFSLGALAACGLLQGAQQATPTAAPTPTLDLSGIPTPAAAQDPAGVPSLAQLDSLRLVAVEFAQEETTPVSAPKIVTTTLAAQRAPVQAYLQIRDNVSTGSGRQEGLRLYFLDDDTYVKTSFGWLQMRQDMITVTIGYLPSPSEVEQTYQEFLGWVERLQFEEVRLRDGLPVYHYSFDQNDLDLAALPAKMTVSAAHGDLDLAAADGHLVWAEVSFQGSDLKLSAQRTRVDVRQGTLRLTLQALEVNQLLTIELPQEVVETITPPEDIPVIARADTLVAGIMNGTPFFYYEMDITQDEAAEFYKRVMAENGWNQGTATEESPRYTYIYIKDRRTTVIDIGVNPANGKPTVALTVIKS